MCLYMEIKDIHKRQLTLKMYACKEFASSKTSVLKQEIEGRQKAGRMSCEDENRNIEAKGLQIMPKTTRSTKQILPQPSKGGNLAQLNQPTES